MNNRRVALVVFLIGLIVLSAGFIVFFSRQTARKNNLQTNVLTVPASDSAVNNQAAQEAAAKPSPAAFTEEQINQKIETTKQQIRADTKIRPYTDEELYFLAFPRQAAVEQLKQGK